MWNEDGSWWWDGSQWVSAQEVAKRQWRARRRDENLGILIPLAIFAGPIAIGIGIVLLVAIASMNP